MSLLEKHYTQEHQIFRESIRRYFEKEVTPRVEEWEKAGIVPKSVWKDFGSQGFLCPWLPEAYGGVGADLLYSLISMEEGAKTRFSGSFVTTPARASGAPRRRPSTTRRSWATPSWTWPCSASACTSP